MDPRARDRYRWVVMAMPWAADFLRQADRQVYSVALDPLRADLGLSGCEDRSAFTPEAKANPRGAPSGTS